MNNGLSDFPDQSPTTEVQTGLAYVPNTNLHQDPQDGEVYGISTIQELYGKKSEKKKDSKKNSNKNDKKDKKAADKV